LQVAAGGAIGGRLGSPPTAAARANLGRKSPVWCRRAPAHHVFDGGGDINPRRPAAGLLKSGRAIDHAERAGAGSPQHELCRGQNLENGAGAYLRSDRAGVVAADYRPGSMANSRGWRNGARRVALAGNVCWGAVEQADAGDRPGGADDVSRPRACACRRGPYRWGWAPQLSSEQGQTIRPSFAPSAMRAPRCCWSKQKSLAALEMCEPRLFSWNKSGRVVRLPVGYGADPWRSRWNEHVRRGYLARLVGTDRPSPASPMGGPTAGFATPGRRGSDHGPPG